MCTFQRYLHPVGQGAFFTEKILDDNNNVVFTAVYDCGSTTKSPLDKVINLAIEKNEHIDLLCISHFDKDHISGLSQLISHATFDDKTVVMIPFKFPHALVVFNHPIASIIIQLQQKGAKLVGVIGHNLESDETLPNNDSLDLFNLKDGNKIKSGTRICYNNGSHNPIWIYVPLMHKDKYQTALSEFYNMIQNNGLDEKKLVDSIYINENKNKLKEIYDKVPTVASKGNISKINMNSLMLLSYPAEIDKYVIGGFVFHKCCYSYMRSRSNYIIPSCLYTGDTNLKNQSTFNNLINIVLHYCQKPLGLLQIPHHGSKNNFNIHIAKKHKDQYQFAFVNFKPRLYTFSREIPLSFLLINRPLLAITDDPLTEFIQIIKL